MGRVLGIDSYLPHELSLSLGGCEVCFAILLLNIMMIKFKIDTCMCIVEYHSTVITHAFPDYGMFQCSYSLSFAAIVHHKGDC